MTIYGIIILEWDAFKRDFEPDYDKILLFESKKERDMAYDELVDESSPEDRIKKKYLMFQSATKHVSPDKSVK